MLRAKKPLLDLDDPGEDSDDEVGPAPSLEFRGLSQEGIALDVIPAIGRAPFREAPHAIQREPGVGRLPVIGPLELGPQLHERLRGVDGLGEPILHQQLMAALFQLCCGPRVVASQVALPGRPRIAASWFRPLAAGRRGFAGNPREDQADRNPAENGHGLTLSR